MENKKKWSAARRAAHAAKKGNGKGRKAKSAAIVGGGKCLCGCGRLTAKRRVFLQGHDSILRHKVLAKLAEAEDHKFNDEQRAYLKTAHWMPSGALSQI